MTDIPLPARLWQLATAHFLPRCLHVAAELGIADQIGAEPVPLPQLARKAGCDAPSLGRLLRLLATADVFLETASGWSHTELSRHLRSDHPQSMRAFIRMIGGRIQWAAAGELKGAVETGRAATKSVVSGGLWTYLADHPEEARIFDAAMTAKSFAEIAALLPAFDFTPYPVIADIGGGRGHVLSAVLSVAPDSTGILYDLPHVVADAVKAPRMQVQGGDFFRDPIPAADAYLVSQVLHDWADGEATAILRAIRLAARAGSHLLVCEQVLPQGPGPHPAKVLDVIMLTLTGGHERTRAGYAELFAAGGFHLERLVPTQGAICVLVGTPV